MSAAKLTLFSLTLSFALSAAANPSSQAPAPAIDCLSYQMGLADCLPFVSVGNGAMSPSKSCCNGLITALKTDPATGAKCLCQGFEQSSTYGITLNMTNANDLPKRCHVSNFSVSQCQFGPAAAPGSAAAPGPASATPGSPSGVPPSASLVPGTPPTASSVPGTPSGADAVSPNVAPSSPSPSASCRLRTSVQLFVSTIIFAVFCTLFS